MKPARSLALLVVVLAIGLALGWWAGRQTPGAALQTGADQTGATQTDAANTASHGASESTDRAHPADPATRGDAAAGSTPPQRPAPTLEFAASDLLTLAPTSIARTIPLTGTLRPSNQTLVRAKVAGELVDITVREGMPVRAGERIAQIDPTEFEARVREREAQRRSAQAQLEQAQRTRDNNRQLLARGFISQNAFDNAQSGADVAQANLDALTAQLAQARKALADTAVLAPMNGVVAERFAQIGEKVSADTRILSIVDLSRMEIEAPVPASEIGQVRIGQAVSLRIEGIDAPQPGEIVRINPATAAGTRSVPVYIGLDNRDPRIRAGLFAQGALAVAQRAAALVVPEAAVRDAAGRQFVYRVVDDRLTEATVTLGLRDPAGRAPNGSTGVVEVLEGLSAGDRIVGVNLGTLRPGSMVRVAPTAAGAQTPAQPPTPDAATSPAPAAAQR